MGVDSIHAGMWGGYLSDTKNDLSEWMSILTSTHDLGFKKTVPSLSCGSHPGLVDSTVKNLYLLLPMLTSTMLLGLNVKPVSTLGS